MDSNYTSATLTTERYACSGTLTGGNSATKTSSIILGSNRRCSSFTSYFECSGTGSKIGHLDCSSDALIEEFSAGSCFACDDYVFACPQIWWKGTYYDGRYFKLACNSPGLSADGGTTAGRWIGWTSVVLAFGSAVLVV